jgi:2-methylcitrate dehydratase PrpD
VVAAAILRKRVFLEAMERDAVLDRRVLDLTKKIDVINDPAIKLKVPVTVEIETKRGELLRGRVDQIKGNPVYPLTDDEVWEKFLNCAEYSARPFSREELEILAETIGHLEALPDAGTLAGRMVPKQKT